MFGPEAFGRGRGELIRNTAPSAYLTLGIRPLMLGAHKVLHLERDDDGTIVVATLAGNGGALAWHPSRRT